MNAEEPGSLGSPADHGGVPALAAEFKSRERDEDRLTRKPLELWDRIKLILLFLGAWVVMLWANLAQFDPAISSSEALNQTLRGYWWLLGLAAVEAVRQIHYLISEHSASWHRRWTGLFARAQKRTGRMNDWTRFRISRVLKLLFILAIVDLFLAKIYHLPPATALIQLPIAITKALPFAFQLAFGFLFVMFQFIGLFWFLSRGGVDVYMPDDIKTRFTDVRGQDLTKWTYRFEPDAGGTKVTESFEMMADQPGLITFFERNVMRVKDRKADLEQGMQATLQRIKAAVEGSAS